MLATDYQKFIHTSRYARWLDTQKRRETWEETVQRYMDNVVAPKLANIPDKDRWISLLQEGITSTGIMPSMRALMTAGPALERDNTCSFNCSYLAVDDPRAFDEAMFILLCGTGVGFTVERDQIAKLPPIPDEFFKVDMTITVADSKEGWATSFRELIEYLYKGQIPLWDTTRVRPAGARLKTFGGRASGPAPLIELFQFAINTFLAARGRKLTSIECHDLMCKIGQIVIVGGVRRSAMISLSNLSDDRLRHAKSGQWWEANPQRSLSNNSVVYTEKPDTETFLREWLSLIESKSGERGIVNRVAANNKVGENGRREMGHQWGTNPCGEIILRPNQMCNLTEVVVKEKDTFKDIANKVMLATILGTIQSTLTYFPYLRDSWKVNTEEERLLGVSLTGVMDNLAMSGLMDKNMGIAYDFCGNEDSNLADILDNLKNVAIQTNKEWAGLLGIPVSTAITTNKPSGTVSQLVDSASGIHPRHSDYYIRTVRGDNKDPLTQFMKDQGIPNEPEANQPKDLTVFSFPMKAPEGAITRNNLTAIEQLELWLTYKTYWCEHNPSVTITVRDHEWIEVGAWIYKNFDLVSGVSFLPHMDHAYVQPPYQEVGEQEYTALLESLPESIDWVKLAEFEKRDNTKSSQTFACVGDCEIVDI